jgi:hypothetical protein
MDDVVSAQKGKKEQGIGCGGFSRGFPSFGSNGQERRKRRPVRLPVRDLAMK